MQAKPPHDFCRDPFEHTLDAIISGDATAKDQVILNDTLRLDPDARRRYIETIAFEAMLAREFAPTEETPTVKAAASRNWRAPLAVAASRAVAIDATSKTDEERWKDSGKAFAGIVGTEDFKEGPKAFIEKRAPVWKGK